MIFNEYLGVCDCDFSHCFFLKNGVAGGLEIVAFSGTLRLAENESVFILLRTVSQILLVGAHSLLEVGTGQKLLEGGEPCSFRKVGVTLEVWSAILSNLSADNHEPTFVAAVLGDFLIITRLGVVERETDFLNLVVLFNSHPYIGHRCKLQ